MTAVRELFHIEYGQNLALKKLKPSSPDRGIAFVSRTARNNGVAAWIERIPEVEPLPPGRLTVCLRSRNYALATFVQPRAFYCGYHIFVLTPKHPMTLKEKLWWAECISANRYRYNAGRQANRTLRDLTLPDDIPDWVEQVELPKFEPGLSGGSSADLDAHGWTHYRLDALFEVVRGRRVLRRDMRPGKTAYVSALSTNNGVSAWIAEPPTFGQGAITVASNGNGVGSAFYQPYSFTASGDVTVLLAKRALSEAAALFVCTIISAEKYRWNYGRKWSAGRVRESIIRLPARADGSPDWLLAESYMRRLRLGGTVLKSSGRAKERA